MWVLTTQKAWQAFCAAYMSFVRRAVRPIARFSSKLLNNAEACAAVGVLTPEDAIHAARFRQLAQLVDNRSWFLWRTLVQAQDWLDAAAISLQHITHTTGQSTYPPVPSDAAARLKWCANLTVPRGACKGMLKRFCGRCIKLAETHATEAVRKASCYRDVERVGGFFVLASKL